MNTVANQSLVDRSAVVTGSSTGIGRAIALEMAAAGADVLVHARSNRTAAERTAAEIEGMGRATHIILCDLADESSHTELVEQAFDWRPIDVWVNNAGADVLTGDAADRSFAQKLDLLWRVDVRATIGLARAAGERMRARGRGVILNMGWDQSSTGMAGDSGEMFAAVKGAIEAFSRSLAKSLAPEVRVNCLAPGWIKTDWGEQASHDWQARAVRESLAGRWGTPEDVARTVRFLASDEAAFLNGQTIAINGGAGQRG